MSKLEIEIGKGPLVTEVTRDQALAAVKNHPYFPKTAAAIESVTLDEVEGRWVVAFVKDSGGPPFGAPADSDDEAPGPKSEGPDDTSDGSDGPPSPDPMDGPPKDEDGPPKKEKGEDKGGDKALLHHIMDTLTQITMALGLPDAGGASMAPGAEDTPMPPGPADAGPPAPGDPHGGDTHVIHERSLKPGEAPPGGTPIGAPAFSSVDPNHPWAHIVGKVASFDLDEAIGNTPMSQVYAETEHLAKTSGFKVKQLYDYTTDDGERRARGQVSIY